MEYKCCSRRIPSKGTLGHGCQPWKVNPHPNIAAGFSIQGFGAKKGMISIGFVHLINYLLSYLHWICGLNKGQIPGQQYWCPQLPLFIGCWCGSRIPCTAILSGFGTLQYFAACRVLCNQQKALSATAAGSHATASVKWEGCWGGSWHFSAIIVHRTIPFPEEGNASLEQ